VNGRTYDNQELQRGDGPDHHVGLGSATTMVAADWPSFRGPAHDGKSAESITAPVFANGKVFARNTKGDVVAVDLSGK